MKVPPFPPVAVLAITVVLVSPVKADDNALHNVYRSLSKFGHDVKAEITDDGDHDRSEPASRHGATRHSSTHSRRLKHAEKDEDSDASAEADHHSGTPKPSPSPSPKADSATGSEEDSTPAKQKGAKHGQAAAPGTESPEGSPTPQVSSLSPEALKEYRDQPPKVQELIRESLLLTTANLNYQYGSADPANGGMDCSGFIYYVLQRVGFRDVPRDSSGQYVWVRKNSDFHAVLSRNEDTFELKDLRPGDLLFWSGTYEVNRDIPITHVMIYLGTDKQTGRRLMVGASDGRTYRGERRYGVSVFDFKLPSGQAAKDAPDRIPKFEGYATIPGLRPPSLAQNHEPRDRPAASATPSPKRTSRGD